MNISFDNMRLLCWSALYWSNDFAFD